MYAVLCIAMTAGAMSVTAGLSHSKIQNPAIFLASVEKLRTIFLDANFHNSKHKARQASYSVFSCCARIFHAGKLYLLLTTLPATDFQSLASREQGVRRTCMCPT